MTLAEYDRALRNPLVQRIIAAERKLEAGCTANERTLRMNDPTHIRLVGEAKTLCGVPLSPGFHTRWQWYGRGLYGEFLPHAMRESLEKPGSYPACGHCAKHPIVTITKEAEDARIAAFRMGSRA
jgi:hypothetical protein